MSRTATPATPSELGPDGANPEATVGCLRGTGNKTADRAPESAHEANPDLRGHGAVPHVHDDETPLADDDLERDAARGDYIDYGGPRGDRGTPASEVEREAVGLTASGGAGRQAQAAGIPAPTSHDDADAGAQTRRAEPPRRWPRRTSDALDRLSSALEAEGEGAQLLVNALLRGVQTYRTCQAPDEEERLAAAERAAWDYLGWDATRFLLIKSVGRATREAFSQAPGTINELRRPSSPARERAAVVVDALCVMGDLHREGRHSASLSATDRFLSLATAAADAAVQDREVADAVDESLPKAVADLPGRLDSAVQHYRPIVIEVALRLRASRGHGPEPGGGDRE